MIEIVGHRFKIKSMNKYSISAKKKKEKET